MWQSKLPIFYITHPSAVCYSPLLPSTSREQARTLRVFYPTHNAHKLLTLFFLPVIRFLTEYINRNRICVVGSKICRNAVRRRKEIGININITITIKQEYDTLLHKFTN